VGISATALFADYLFAVLPLRKLYLRSISYSFDHYRSLVRRGYAVIEGVLRDYEYFGGRYWDVYILAVDRERFMDLRERTRVGRR
jgi:RimJ/RimL family protein N-acetyltransferase